MKKSPNKEVLNIMAFASNIRKREPNIIVLAPVIMKKTPNNVRSEYSKESTE